MVEVVCNHSKCSTTSRSGRLPFVVRRVTRVSAVTMTNIDSEDAARLRSLLLHDRVFEAQVTERSGSLTE